MIEKREAEEFDAADDDDILESDGDDAADLVHLTGEMEHARKRSAKPGMPALRKLEMLAEQKRTAELTSDFDDYDLDEPQVSRGRKR
jgi:hypothetical protein